MRVFTHFRHQQKIWFLICLLAGTRFLCNVDSKLFDFREFCLWLKAILFIFNGVQVIPYAQAYITFLDFVELKNYPSDIHEILRGFCVLLGYCRSTETLSVNIAAHAYIFLPCNAYKSKTPSIRFSRNFDD